MLLCRRLRQQVQTAVDSAHRKLWRSTRPAPRLNHGCLLPPPLLLRRQRLEYLKRRRRNWELVYQVCGLPAVA